MKKNLTLFLILLLMGIGCTYEGSDLSSYFENPRSIIKDPHFANYKEKRDEIETQYLHKEISYDEYVNKMNDLDEKYAKEVQERDSIISSSR